MAIALIDASVVLTWFVPARTQPEQEFCDRIWTRIVELGITMLAPSIFDLEIAGGLLKARRSKLISLARFTQARAACAGLPVQLYGYPYSSSQIIELALMYHAQAPDALYLHVAQTHNAKVITVDSGMAQACRQSRIEVETFNRS